MGIILSADIVGGRPQIVKMSVRADRRYGAMRYSEAVKLNIQDQSAFRCPSRFALRALKWIGAIICVLLVLAWGASCLWPFTWNPGANAAASFSCGLNDGIVWIIEWQKPSPQAAAHDISYVHPNIPFGLVPPTFWRGPTGGWVVVVPLWIVLMIAIVPTIMLYRAEHRPAPGSCRQCGYDLTGNVSGRCPECGMLIGR